MNAPPSGTGNLDDMASWVGEGEAADAPAPAPAPPPAPGYVAALVELTQHAPFLLLRPLVFTLTLRPVFPLLKSAP